MTEIVAKFFDAVAGLPAQTSKLCIQTQDPWDLDSGSLGFPSLSDNSSTPKLFYYYGFIIQLLLEHCSEHCVLYQKV
jgi:hypothetical protein